jgi:hypothetical protein
MLLAGLAGHNFKGHIGVSFNGLGRQTDIDHSYHFDIFKQMNKQAKKKETTCP